MKKIIDEFDFESIRGIWRVGNSLYVVDQPALLELLKQKLDVLGYRLTDLVQEANKNCVNDRNFGHVGQTNTALTNRGSFQKQRQALWRATLKTKSFFRCNSCNEKMTFKPVKSGQKCKNCEKVLWNRVTKGSKIRGRFKPHKPKQTTKVDFTAYVHSYNPETLELLLEDRIYGGKFTNNEQAKKYFHEHSHKWKRVTIGKKTYIKVIMPITKVQLFVPHIHAFQITGEYINYHEVKVWNGQEYRLLPITEKFRIYEAWEWSLDEINKILSKRKK